MLRLPVAGPQNVTIAGHLCESNADALTVRIKNTFLDFEAEDGHEIWDDRSAKTCVARLAASTPELFFAGDDDDDDDAISAAQSLAEAVVATPTVAAAAQAVGSPSILETMRSSDVRGAANSTRVDLKFTVKNTFIDVESEDVATPARGAQTCHARLTGLDAEFHPDLTSPKSDAGAEDFRFDQRIPSVMPPLYTAPTFTSEFLAEPVPPSASPKVCLEGRAFEAETTVTQSSLTASSLPSEGSRLHGTTGPEGPVCRPCAWFQKDGNCLNGVSCGFCHLCPQGELKIRKKLKIARIRKGTSPNSF